MRRSKARLARWIAVIGLAAACPLVGPTIADATPLDFISVGHPLEDEWRRLDVIGWGSTADRERIPHLHTRPLQRMELRPGVPFDDRREARAISLARIEREVWIDALDAGEAEVLGANPADTVFAHGQPPPGSTPRWLQFEYPLAQRVEISAALEGRRNIDEDESKFASGSGAVGRIGVTTGRWLGYVRLLGGYIEGARTFADPVFDDRDLIVYTDESYVAYTGTSALWSAQFGRSRWHWGPGDQGSLLLSKTSPALTGLALHVRIAPLHADGIALSATIDAAAGEQLAAHRLEWQPSDGLRLGVAEAARYKSPSWEPLYLVGVIPYVLVQRLLAQDAPVADDSLRNNIMVSFDLAWRIAPGTRVYAEWLVDDFRTKDDGLPDKYAYQIGLEGVGMALGSRLSWGVEHTRLTRYVYTSYFGRSFVSQNEPLGFPTGPDSRRTLVRLSVDPTPSWQFGAMVSATDHGENELDEPFVPGSPPVDATEFEGVVEHRRQFDLIARYWPSRGIDLQLDIGYEWIENSAHAAGFDEEGVRGALSLRLTR